ncbi:aquaporin-3 [Pongo abelii]|uniref:Aquaporin-3 n=2 Tax=Pongo abelii TaxID=9601 RepID=H2PRX5_PONAB|nr:aquaporin-3 [Pongo abelii]
MRPPKATGPSKLLTLHARSSLHPASAPASQRRWGGGEGAPTPRRSGTAGRDCRVGLHDGRGPCLPRSYKGSHQRWRPLLAAPAASRHPCSPDSAAACPAMGRQKELVSRCGEMLHIRYRLLRQALAECLGTLILVMFGCGSVAQVVLSRGTHGGFLTINLAFGFAVTLGILIAGQVSGAHLNPAVTFAMCVLAREPWIKLPIYTLAQTLGAFLGAGIVFGLYYDAIWGFGNNQLFVSGPNGTAGIFATYPSGHLDMTNGFFDQFIGTASLIVCVLAIVDPYNNPVPRGLEAFTVGLVVLVIGTSMGFNSGYAVNPARDFGPRLFTALAGWGSGVFTTGRHWWWVPIVSPLLGSVAGVFVYQLMIGCHLEQPPPSTEQENVKLAHVKHKEQI